MKSKTINKLAGLPIVIAGLLFAVIGYFINVNDKKYYEYPTAEAKILDIDTLGDDTDVLIEFYVNNTSIKGYSNYYDSQMRVGDTIIVYYNPSNPTDYLVDGNINISVIFMIVGTIIFVFGTFTIIRLNLKYKKYLNVKNTGIRVDARISGIEVDTSIAINNKNPYYILCYGVNPITGQEQTFRSENVWEDVRKIIEDNNIDILPVYIDQSNHNNYYVDISVLNIK